MTTDAATNDSTRKNIVICDTQPVAVEGMKWLIENSGDLRFAGSVPTLEAVHKLLYPEAAASSAESTEEESSGVEISEVGQMDACVLADTPGDLAFCVAAVSATETLEAVEPIFDATAEPVLVAEYPVPEHIMPEQIDAIVIDKGLGFPAVMDLLQRLTANSHPTPVVVWGSAVSEPEALRLLQAGARGILRRTSESGTLLTCLRAVTSGGTWMEDGIFGSTDKLFNPKRSQLTNRESQVVLLVEKGLRNRDIARQLGIQTGTVKIHLKHIFEKTGVRGRYGLAFTGLQNKGSISPNQPRHFTA